MTRITLFALTLGTILSCNSKNEVPETATSGMVRVLCDESYQPIVHQEKVVFEYQYKYAQVLDSIVPQERGHELFLKDSVQLLFSSRTLSEHEIAYLKSKKVYPKIYEFGRDALVLLVNARSKDTVFSVKQLKDIASDTSRSGKILVVDNSKGGSIASFVQQLGLSTQALVNVFSADSVDGVIEFVSKNEHAIGVLGSAWCSDQDDPKVQEILKRVIIAGVRSPNGNTFRPFQSEMADSLYPLTRTIYVISRESKMGLANGFSSFLLGEKGQRILLKAGLLPSRIPNREVVLSKKGVF